jgi:hypothetical protein
VTDAIACLIVGASVSCGSSDTASHSSATPQVTMTAAQTTEMPLACADIGFAPQSDNIATHIVATGTDCSEAQALVRKVAAEHNVTTRPRELTSGAFACSVVTEDVALPVSHYICIDGARKVTWDEN